MSLKPSIARWALIDQFKYTNEIISNEIAQHSNWTFIDIFKPMLNDDGKPNSDFFIADGLHLNIKGYQLWGSIVQKVLNLERIETTVK